MIKWWSPGSNQFSFYYFCHLILKKINNFEITVNGDSKGAITCIIFCLLNLMYHPSCIGFGLLIFLCSTCVTELTGISRTYTVIILCRSSSTTCPIVMAWPTGTRVVIYNSKHWIIRDMWLHSCHINIWQLVIALWFNH